MTCRDVIDVLAEYLDELLSPAVAAELEGHLRDCPPCVAYLETYRKTQHLAGHAGRVEMPAELKARLRRFLLEHLEDGP
jgi:anti-sigma factor RsiW